MTKKRRLTEYFGLPAHAKDGAGRARLRAITALGVLTNVFFWIGLPAYIFGLAAEWSVVLNTGRVLAVMAAVTALSAVGLHRLHEAANRKDG
jgi:hypothetical protein|tara:strand:- start:108 stop:383 length:276 start_codon:yes stop_codon:yes gene_type:complete